MISVTAAHHARLLRLITTHLPHTTVWAYGSWLTRESHPQRHIDLIAFVEPERDGSVSALRKALPTSGFPLPLSLRTWSQLPKPFQDTILQEHMVLTKAVHNVQQTPLVVHSAYSTAAYRRLLDLPPDPYVVHGKKTTFPKAHVRHTSRHPWPHYFRPATADACVPGTVLWALWLATSPAEEVAAMTIGLNDRNRELILGWLGALGKAPSTQAALARKYHITRARVGQLIHRFLDTVARWRIRLPWCEIMLDRLQCRGGVLHSSLVDAVETNALNAMVGASQLGLLSSSVHRDDNLDSWVTQIGRRTVSAYRDRLATVLPPIRRQRRQWGAFRIDLLPASANLPKETRIQLALPSNPPSWRVHGHLVVFYSSNSTLVRICRKALAALTSLCLDDLHRGIERALRSTPPSRSELAIILSSHDAFRVDNECCVSHIDPLDVNTTLTPAERSALAILRDAGGVIDSDGYIFQMQRNGHSRQLAGALLRSPFVYRVERAVYALLGTPITSGQIQTARSARSNRFRNSLVKVERHASRVELHYRLSHPCLADGRLPCPAFLPNGQWKASLPDGSSLRCNVRGSTVSGFRPWMRRAGIAVNSPLSLQIRAELRLIRVLVPD